MEKIKKICKACGQENLRLPKPDPKNAREANQVDFICEKCGAKNLRNGTAAFKKEAVPVKQDPGKNKEGVDNETKEPEEPKAVEAPEGKGGSPFYF
jgi:hypothetical protein